MQRYEAGERYFADAEIPEGSDLRNSTLSSSIFERMLLTEIDFRGANLRDASFRDCNVKCSDFRGADLEGATFRGSLLEATYFGSANLTGVSFAGAFVYGYELKDGDMPDAEGQF
ncbi:MAG: pentapeptide repeat-containing protein [Chloroflexota bacterium]|nr:pentapeptide repeat-containing protein [Chloroflexota bacterium]